MLGIWYGYFHDLGIVFCSTINKMKDTLNIYLWVTPGVLHSRWPSQGGLLDTTCTWKVTQSSKKLNIPINLFCTANRSNQVKHTQLHIYTVTMFAVVVVVRWFISQCYHLEHQTSNIPFLKVFKILVTFPCKHYIHFNLFIRIRIMMKHCFNPSIPPSLTLLPLLIRIMYSL